MKSDSFKIKIDLAFLAGIIILAAVMYLTIESSQQLKQRNFWMDHTRKILFQIEKILNDVKDIETGACGFIITGNEEFLEPRKSARDQVYANLDTLRSLFANDSLNLHLVDSMRQLINKKIAFSDHGVAIRKTDVDEALRFVSSELGKEAMDNIRDLAQKMEEQESSELTYNIQDNTNTVVASNRNLILLCGMVLISVFMFYIIVRRNAAELINYQTKQDELIRELNFQNRQLDDFAGITSHNLRSPVSNITALISLLNDNSNMDEYKLIFDKLKKVSVHLNETLKDLTEVLQIKKDKHIERQTLSFEDIYLKVKDSLAGEIIASKTTLETDFSNAPRIEYPKPYMESIFHNLISNALKYRAKDRAPVIVVKTGIQNGKIFLSVEDNGLGIDMAVHGDKLFGLRKTFHAHSEAKGLGLFMTKAQIEALGGKIVAESEVNKGSQFTVFF